MIDLTTAVFTDHAFRQMARRGLAERDVWHVLAALDAVRQVRPGRVVAQKILHIGEPAHETLVRVFVDIDRMPLEIVTTDRTSKLVKYRSV